MVIFSVFYRIALPSADLSCSKLNDLCIDGEDPRLPPAIFLGNVLTCLHFCLVPSGVYS